MDLNEFFDGTRTWGGDGRWEWATEEGGDLDASDSTSRPGYADPKIAKKLASSC